MILNCNFDNDTIPASLQIQDCCNYSQKFETDTTRFNRGTAYRFHLNHNDQANHGGVRSELSASKLAQTEGWYGLSAYIPSSYVSDPIPDIITQFHNVLPDTITAPSSVPVVLSVQNDRYIIHIQWSSNSGTTIDGSIDQDCGPADKNVWTDWVWHIKWSYQADGVLQVWKNGVKIIDRTGPNCYNDGSNPYFKCGEYKPGWDYSGIHTPGITDRDIYFDNVKIAKAAGTYNDVEPKIDSPLIASFAPLHAAPGSTIVIKGTNFNEVTGVTIGGVPAASYTIVSSTSIRAVVPATNNDNYIAVTGNGVTDSLGGFTFLQLRATITGGINTCQNPGTTAIAFKGDGGYFPYTFYYTVNNGPQQSISTVGGNPTIKVAAPTTTAGNFVYTLVSVTDSVGSKQTEDTSVTVTINPPVTSSTAVTVLILNLPYSWNGKNYTATGSYTVHLTSATGCDSAATLVLTVVAAKPSNTPL